ncbi:MAG: GNAT family N-acetyltransferase [Chitinophagaceae bacterium]|nr:GNAT family N-acetyltransferase [Chitinophagaceae bacterium]
MQIREARIEDIPAIQVVRNAVKENRLSDPSLVPDSDVEDYLFNRGKGWVAEWEGRIVGFAIADLVDHNIWALFMDPGYEARGIGRMLHKQMLDWYFSQTAETVWLGTEPKSRAEQFYRLQGWTETGLHGKGEIKFEMSKVDWIRIRTGK